MKLTQEIKTELDSYSVAKLKSLFRFFPSDYTTGESGRYIQEIAKKKMQDEERAAETPGRKVK